MTRIRPTMRKFAAGAVLVILIGTVAGCGKSRKAPAVAQNNTGAYGSPPSATQEAQPASGGLESIPHFAVGDIVKNMKPTPPPAPPPVVQSPPQPQYQPPPVYTPPPRVYTPPPVAYGNTAPRGQNQGFGGGQYGNMGGLFPMGGGGQAMGQNQGFGGGFGGVGGGIGGFGGGGFGGGIGGGGFGGGVPSGYAARPTPAVPVPGVPAMIGAAQRAKAGEPNTEKYGVYRENEFRSPQTAALSTFSADVNTASYSNVRRMLKDGKLPVKDAVFLAEFVNYFPYAYAAPKGDDPVAFALEVGPCPWNRRHHLVRVGVQAKTFDPAQMPPRNLVFLIDTSGSMSDENRLPLVKKSLALLVDTLTAKDVVSIVTYAGDSRVALLPTRAIEKERIKRVIAGLGASGSTNGEGGLRTAYKLARDSYIDGGVNRVILCTDGDFNVGVTGEGELVRMIEEQRRSRVFLTILGFGMGNYKDNTLKELANHGNGHHAYIDTLEEARKVFVEQGGALACVAKDVKFQVEFNPARVAAYRLIGYENRLLKDEDFKNDAKDAGDMGSGHQATVLYEVVPVGVAVDVPGVDPLKYQAAKEGVASDEWLTVKMRYKHPDAETSQELSKPLHAAALAKEPSDDFRFAASVASFGMLLRDSQHKGVMTYNGVLAEAIASAGKDTGRHRRDFLELVRKAEALSAKAKPKGPSAKDVN